MTTMTQTCAPNVAEPRQFVAPPEQHERDTSEGSIKPYHEAKIAAFVEFQRRYLSTLLERADGNISEAARLSGVHRATLYRMLDRCGLASLPSRGSVAARELTSGGAR